MADPRTAHPYCMHDGIRAQPGAWTATVQRHLDEACALARRVRACDRVFLVGIGTSFHAAQAGEAILRHFEAHPDPRAIHAFDFALYGPPLRPTDAVIVISHRGTKGHSVRSLERARNRGCVTALVTGEGTPDAARMAEHLFRTVPQERSPAHTVSFAGSVAVLAALGVALAAQAPDPNGLTEDLVLSAVPAAIRETLATEDRAASLAREHAGRRRIWLLGGGPAAIVAAEGALKIKETSYLQAEGLSTEAMIHGPLRCVESDDLFVLVAPEGPAFGRTMELAGMIREIGAPCVVVSDRAPGPDAPAWIRTPACPEPFAAITCLVPVQFLAYHLALARGTNPDSFRAEDPRFARASARITL